MIWELLLAAFIIAVLMFAAYEGILLLGEFVNRRRHPDDATLYDLAMKEVRSAPERFPVVSTHHLEINDGIYRMKDGGSLYVQGANVILSERQQTKVKKLVRRLWKSQNRIDAKKRQIIRDLPR